jgi:hypothetical protein
LKKNCRRTALDNGHRRAPSACAGPALVKVQASEKDFGLIVPASNLPVSLFRDVKKLNNKKAKTPSRSNTDARTNS